MFSKIFEETEVEVCIMELRDIICNAAFVIYSDGSGAGYFFTERNIFPKLRILRLTQDCIAPEN